MNSCNNSNSDTLIQCIKEGQALNGILISEKAYRHNDSMDPMKGREG